MEENKDKELNENSAITDVIHKNIKIKLSTVILIGIIFVIVIVLGVYLILNYYIEKDLNRFEEQENHHSYVYQDERSLDSLVGKPIIYIYPEKEEELSIKLGYPQKLTSVYPEYNNGWNVTAKPNGTLTDEKIGKEYYSLYYECDNTKKYSGELKEGFVVSKENITKFLEEKLAILGLNEREAEEFIIYWLPKLQQYEYIYVRFQTLEEIEENMPLILSKTPDTLIRIMMEWKGLNEYIEVKEQELNPVTRSGFTVVEWGGTILK